MPHLPHPVTIKTRETSYKLSLSAKRQNSFQFQPVLSVFPVPRNLERELSRKIITFCKVQIRLGSAELNHVRPYQVSMKKGHMFPRSNVSWFLPVFNIFFEFLRLRNPWKLKCLNTDVAKDNTAYNDSSKEKDKQMNSWHGHMSMITNYTMCPTFATMR